MKRFLSLLAGAAMLATPAWADETGATASEFEMNYGFGYGAEDQPIEPGTRDANGNRVVINGRIGMEGSTLPGGLQFDDDTGFIGAASAVGNQLNVVTNGSFNTVIIDSTQINNGNQTATVRGN